MSDTNSKWFVFAVSYRKEIEIKEELTSKGFESYVPMHYQLKTSHGHKIRKLEPSVYGLVFVRGIRENLFAFRDGSRLKQYMFLKSMRLQDGSLEYITVRDAEMDNFRRLNDIGGAYLTYYRPEEIRLAKGEKVKIMDGPFEGIIGTIQKLPHKKGQYLIVSLPNVAIAAVSIKPEYIKPLTHKVEKSKNVEKDCQELAQKSLTLLKTPDIANRNVFVENINMLRQALDGCKTFLPNDKARMHFAFYVAALALGKDYGIHKEELEKLLPKLKANNLIIPLSHIIFYIESKDEAELAKAEAITTKWDNRKYTDAQRQILTLQKQATKKRKP